MTIEKIGDVVSWARRHHDALSSQLASSSADSGDNERLRLLLAYLSAHEKKLSDLLELMEADGDLKALQTHCYDYLDESPYKPHPEADVPWTALTPEEIMQRIEHDHNQLIALYRHLRGQVDRIAAQVLLDELIALEEHDAMLIAQGANRLNDY